jgi:hypothetical protein
LRAPVFDQAENRLHLQMALLDWVIGSGELAEEDKNL